MKQVCLNAKLRDCQSCGAKKSLNYRMEGNGGDKYYCPKCGIIHLWNDNWKKPKLTENKVSPAFIKPLS